MRDICVTGNLLQNCSASWLRLCYQYLDPIPSFLLRNELSFMRLTCLSRNSFLSGWPHHSSKCERKPGVYMLWDKVSISSKPHISFILSFKFQKVMKDGLHSSEPFISLSFPGYHHKKGEKVWVGRFLCPNPASAGITLLLCFLFFHSHKIFLKNEFQEFYSPQP